MKILKDHADVHHDVMQAWKDNVSACVIPDAHWSEEEMVAIARSYDGAPALITWTSGTTGRPKGVVIPWMAVEARCMALKAWWRPDALQLVTSFLPSFHSGGMITSRLSVICSGGEFAVFPVFEGATCVIGTPNRLRELTDPTSRLLSGGNFDQFKRDLKMVITNGIALRQEDREFLESAYGVPVHDLYGTSETGGVAFDGEPLPGYEIRMRDRIEIRSAANAVGYVGAHDPFPVTEDGFFRTPDIAEVSSGKLAGFVRK